MAEGGGHVRRQRARRRQGRNRPRDVEDRGVRAGHRREDQREAGGERAIADGRESAELDEERGELGLESGRRVGGEHGVSGEQERSDGQAGGGVRRREGGIGGWWGWWVV